MAKVLGQIAERLKTDLGELARATVDPSFSKRRDLSNFENKQHERDRAEALKDRDVLIAERDRKEKLDIQKFSLMKIHDQAINDTSDGQVAWKHFMNLGTGGKLMPQMQEAWGLLAEGVGGRSAEANKTRFQQHIDFQKMSNDQIKFNFSPEKRSFNELIDKRWAKDYDTAQEMLNQKNFNREGLINHLRGTKGIFSDDEKRQVISAMTEVNDQDAKTIYNEAFDAANNRYQSDRGTTAFPERFTKPQPWTTPDGKYLGTVSFGPDGKPHYNRDEQSPLVSMSSGKQAEMVLDDFKEARDSARFSEKTLNNLDFIQATIGDMETGTMTDFKVGLSQMAASLNIPYDKGEIGNLLAARTAAGELVMAKLDNFPGQISNQERQFLEGIMPSLTQTKEGRKLIGELLRRAAEETIARRNMMQKYVNRPEPTYFPEGEKSFFEAWDEYRDENPLWKDIPAPDGGVKLDPKTQALYYESLDGQYRDKNRNIWTPVTETIDSALGVQ